MTSANQTDLFRVLCLGDIVGRPGRSACVRHVAALKELHKIDLVIANGENGAGGAGLDSSTAREIFNSGIDFITLGDHAFQRKDIHPFLERETERIIRPANYPKGAPGRGAAIIEISSMRIGICNLIGRVFIGHLVDCPFYTAELLISEYFKDCKIIIIDMHAEATSEKIAMARLLDGRVSLIFGTHTHVQTADQQILPGGTAYISDLGMCGSMEGVIGMDAQVAIKRFMTGLPHAYQIASGEGILNGIIATFDRTTGRAISIERLNYPQVSTMKEHALQS